MAKVLSIAAAWSGQSMADRELPWSKFFWADWESDGGLRQCSLAAQGLWMRMLCICARSDTRGYLTIAGVHLDVAALATAVSRPETEVGPLMEELERWGVFSRDRKGLIYSRRMVRDDKKSKDGRKFKKEAISKSQQGTDNKEEKCVPSRVSTRGASTQKPEARGQKDISPGEANASPTPLAAERQRELGDGASERPASRGTRLPRDWVLPDDWLLWAHGEGAHREFDVVREAECFRDYWIGRPAGKGVKADWAATWRNWIRRRMDDDRGQQHRRNGCASGDREGGGDDAARQGPLAAAVARRVGRG